MAGDDGNSNKYDHNRIDLFVALMNLWIPECQKMKIRR
jgi:hypothetical protein